MVGREIEEANLSEGLDKKVPLGTIIRGSCKSHDFLPQKVGVVVVGVFVATQEEVGFFLGRRVTEGRRKRIKDYPQTTGKAEEKARMPEILDFQRRSGKGEAKDAKKKIDENAHLFHPPLAENCTFFMGKKQGRGSLRRLPSSVMQPISKICPEKENY